MNIHRQHKHSSRQKHQRGIALVMALVVLFVFSVLGAGVMFSTQTEIWNSASLRGTTQARYAAEAGVAQALTWLNSSSFLFSNIATVFISPNCNYSAIPVTCSMTVNGIPNTPVLPIIGNNGTSGNPATSVIDTWASIGNALASGQAKTDFGNQDISFLALSGNSKNNLTNLPSSSAFSVSAQLLQLNQPTAGIIRAKWKLISVGTVPGMAGNSSSVQVEEIVENTTDVSGGSSNQMFNYGLLTTGTGCKTVYLNGGGTSGSYDSTKVTTVPGVAPPSNFSQGDIASNGNVQISGGYYIAGKLYSPLSGVDSGQQGPGNAWWGTGAGYGSGMGCDATHMFALNEDNSGSAVTAGLASPVTQYRTCFTGGGTCPSGYNLSTLKTLPLTPNATMTVAPNNFNCNMDACSNSGSFNWSAPNTGTWNPTGGVGVNHEQTLSSGAYAFSMAPSDTFNYGNVTPPSSNLQIHLSPGTYNFNSLQLTGSDYIVIDPPADGHCAAPAKTTTPGCSVVINIVGMQNAGDTALSISGGSVVNNGMRPGNLVIQYNGLGNVSVLNGPGSGVALYGGIYAPNAVFAMVGGTGIYGGVVAKTASITGPNGLTSPSIAFDVSLLTDGPPAPGNSPPSVTSFHVDEFTWSAF